MESSIEVSQVIHSQLSLSDLHGQEHGSKPDHERRYHEHNPDISWNVMGNKLSVIVIFQTDRTPGVILMIG